jgi:hypothetical protein
MTMIELSPEQLAQLADLLAERLRGVLPDQPTPTPNVGTDGRLVDAQTVAGALGVDRSTVYEHAHELGGRKIGNGKRGRWSFDLQTALAGVESPSMEIRPAEATKRSVASTLRPKHAQASGLPLMAIRGER